MRKGPRRLLIAAGLGALLALGGAQAAAGHASLLDSDPPHGAALDTAPSDVTLRFDEPMTVPGDAVQLFSGVEAFALDVEVIDATVVAAMPAGLDDGRYAIAYRVTSADGHPIAGTIAFTIGTVTDDDPWPAVVGDTGAGTRIALPILTGALYAGLLAFAGLVAFSVLVLGDRAPPTARLRRWRHAAGALAVVAGLALVPVSALHVVGGPIAFVSGDNLVVLDPAVWLPGILPGPVVTAVLVTLGVLAASVLHRDGPSPRARRISALTATALALAAPLAVGHPLTADPFALALVADLGHLGAGAIWLGGIIGLALLVTRARRESSAEAIEIAAITARFSTVAAWTLLVIAASGLTLAILIMPGPASLLTSDYGTLLLAKLALLVPVLALALWNRARLVPRIRTAPDDRRAWRRLTRVLVAEALLIAAILGVTAVLGGLDPGAPRSQAAASAAAREVIRIDGGGATELTGEVRRDEWGAHEFAFTLTESGAPVDSRLATVIAELPERGIGPLETIAVAEPDTMTFRTTLQLPVAGLWRLTVTTWLPDGETRTVPVTLLLD